jgi:predicted CopG family antitoxin
MPSKNMAIKDDVYRRLTEAKGKGESFSDVIGRLLEGKNDLMSLAGALAGDEGFELALKDIAEVRKRTALRA